jgi:hypothetical protein
MMTRNSRLFQGVTKLTRPAHAPYLCPYRQGCRVLLTPLTYVHIGNVEKRRLKRAIQLVAGFTCWLKKQADYDFSRNRGPPTNTSCQLRNPG